MSDPLHFAYWLKGFFEIGNSNKLTEIQVQIIKDHLDLAFNKVTPDRNIKKEIAAVPEQTYCVPSRIITESIQTPILDCQNKDIEEEGNWQKFWSNIATDSQGSKDGTLIC